MRSVDKPLTGIGLKLFRAWLYAPLPMMFLWLGVKFLLLRFPNTIGTIGFLLCVLTGGGFIYATWKLERRLGHANLFVGPTILGMIGTVFCMIALPLSFYLVSLIRSNGSIVPVDLHFEMSIMSLAAMPNLLLVLPFPASKK